MNALILCVEPKTIDLMLRWGLREQETAVPSTENQSDSSPVGQC